MTVPPALEPRFLQPENWHWGEFKRGTRTLRFGHISAANPVGIVVCLPGLSEFAEKYFEVARTCLDMNLSFWVMDWMGQAGSGRYLSNPHKRHTDGFQNDIEDLHAFITNHVKPANRNLPMIMLGHSMGGNIGLHYLSQHPDIFKCAAFSAPLFGLKVFAKIPALLVFLATSALNILAEKIYAGHGANWRAEMRPEGPGGFFSDDPVRALVHNAWMIANPHLQVGNVTFGWVYHAARSCAHLMRPAILQNIKTPCLIAIAGHEEFVDNHKTRSACAVLPHVQTIDFPEARHEILMEKDPIRNEFFVRFKTLIKENLTQT